MPGMTEICVFLAWIAGGFVSGVSGIGGAMVAFPFLAMLLPVHEAIALTCIVNMVMDICLASLHFRFCRVSALWPMLLASVPGSFAGLYILQICSGPVLQGAVGLLLLYYVYWQKTFRARGTIAHPRALGAVAGFGSGLLGTAIAFDGPPVGAYGLCMGWEPRVLLGTLGVFFVLRATVTLVLQGMAGFYTPTVLTCAMYGAPGVILGTCIAFPVVKHISQQAFRKVLLCVIAVAGLYMLCMKNGFGGIETSDWILLSCAVLFSFQIMSIDHFSPLVDGVRLSLIQFIVVAVESSAAALIFETPTLAEYGANFLPVVYCGVMSSGAGYTLQILGQKDLNPAIASLIMCLESVFSALGGWLLLGQNLSMRESAGCTLIFAAVVLSQLPFAELRRCKKGA